MCGIAGLWYRDGRPVDESSLREMARALAHRGPDGEGRWTAGEIGLTYRRLAIIDPSPDGAQPMESRDGRFVLVFNGEIHNYLELRAELETQGTSFRGHSDTEVFLEAYRTWGEDCFAKFNGMWAAAIWDTTKRRLLLSRDHFGIKPLYWTMRGPRVAFASEIKALLEIAPEERLPDEDSVVSFLSGASPGAGSRTFFENIHAVLPATSLTITESGRSEEKRYWTLDPQPYAGHDDATEFRELLLDSVRLRMRSDVAVGACLSGGLDSSSIVRLALAEGAQALPCFVMRHRDPRYDESRFASDVAPAESIRWIDPGPEELLTTTARIVWHHDAPTPARGRYGQWQTFREAGRNVKVVIDGQGADELLGGYRRFLFPAFLDRVRRNGNRLGSARDLVRSSGGLKRATTAPLSPLFRRYSSRIRPSARLLRREVASRSPAVDKSAFPDSWLCPGVERPFSSHLNNALFGEFFHSGLPELLQAEDAMGMAHGVEARPAFLDRRLVELSFSLPSERKIDGTWRKLLLREAMDGVLPESVQWRRDKKGYALPIAPWLLSHDPNYEGLRELLLSPDSASREYLEPERLDGMLAKRRKRGRGSAYGDELIWRCLTLELWMRQFLGSESFG